MYLDNFTLFTRSKNKGAGRLYVQLHLPTSTGAPSTASARSVLLNIAAGEAKMQKASIYTHPSGPLYVRTSFFIVLPAFFQKYAYWPDLTNGNQTNGQTWQKKSGKWVTHSTKPYLSYVFNCRSNYLRGYFAKYGTGCVGTSSKRLDHYATDPNLNRPELGTLSTYYMRYGRGRALAHWNIGVSATRWGGARLPLDLGIIGAPGCKVQGSLDVQIPIITDLSGGFALRVRHPRTANFLGLKVYTFCASFDRGANKLGVTTSNGLITRLGGTR